MLNGALDGKSLPKHEEQRCDDKRRSYDEGLTEKHDARFRGESSPCVFFLNEP
jgi:hypothetical protein